MGYDHGEFGEAFSGKWNYGNAFQFREADHMKMVVRPGGLRPGPKQLWFFAGYGLQNMPRAVDSLWLSLRKGEYVHYTVRDVKSSCQVLLSLKSEVPGAIRISCGSESAEIHVDPVADLAEYEAILVTAGDEYHIRVEAVEGEVQLAEVKFIE